MTGYDLGYGFKVCAILFLSFLFIIFSTSFQREPVNSADSQLKITNDSSGVPTTDYGYVSETYIGPQRNPNNIARVALEFYDRYNLTQDDRDLQRFINNSNWLMDNAIPRSNYSLLQYDFPWPQYQLQPPWNSALAQGKALDVLTKAHQITGNTTYLDAAKSLLNAFFVEVKDGGITLKTPKEGWWYEEYAKAGAIKPGVLSGMTDALLNLHNYYQYTKDPTAKFLFDQGVLGLKNNLPQFEYAGGQYSTFDALNKTGPASYRHHIAQAVDLGTLYNITGEDTFKTYHDRWINSKLPVSAAQG